MRALLPEASIESLDEGVAVSLPCRLKSRPTPSGTPTYFHCEPISCGAVLGKVDQHHGFQDNGRHTRCSVQDTCSD